MEFEVVLKSLPKQWIASVRDVIPSYPSVGALYGKVIAALGPCMGNTVLPVALWHDPEYKESNVDAEAGFYLKEPFPPADGVKVYELPGATVASTIHNGAYQRLPEAYDALLRWVSANNYQVAAPIRELYLYCSQPVRQDDESYVTEIQVPVKRTGSEASE
jgi:effector-binding domain-containing protein